MRKRKRHTASEIAAKLTHADVLAAKGSTQMDIAGELGVSVMTLHRWRKARSTGLDSEPGIEPMSGQIISLTSSAVQEPPARIAELRLENMRLRKLVTDLLLERMKLEDERRSHGTRSAARRA